MQLVDRTLRTLEILGQHLNGLSVSELSEFLEIPASSTHRILSSLKTNHFILQDEETKKYRLGYKLFSISAGMNRNSTLVLSARPLMKELSVQIGRTVVLCIMEYDKVINVACIEREDAGMYMVKIGRELPLYSTSAGRVFAAYMDRGRALELLDREVREPKTPYTKVSLDELNRELEEVRRVGCCVIDEELQMGIQGVACPVFDLNGHVAAALAFTTRKEEAEQLQRKLEQLKRCAGRISEEIQ